MVNPKITKGFYDNMPEGAECPEVVGLTLCQAVKKFREIDWGSSGYFYGHTSDGGVLKVHHTERLDLNTGRISVEPELHLSYWDRDSVAHYFL